MTAALVVGALFIIWIERRGKKSTTEELPLLRFADCLKIGLFQCLALWPGMSRSASTIIGGILVGANRTVAAEYSFLYRRANDVCGCGLRFPKSASLLSSSDLPIMATGFLVSFVTALLAIKSFIRFLQHHTLIPFAYYRLAVGLVFAVYLLGQ